MQATVYRATWWVGDELVTFLWKSLSWKEYRKSRVFGLTTLRRTRRSTGPRLLRVCRSNMSRPELCSGSPVTNWKTTRSSGELKPIQQQRQRSANWCGSYLNASRALVAWAFGYKFEEIDEWDSNTFFNRLAQAEYVFGKPFEPEDPSAPPPPVDKQGSRKLRRMKP